jgi:hypothetical protein
MYCICEVSSTGPWMQRLGPWGRSSLVRVDAEYCCTCFRNHRSQSFSCAGCWARARTMPIPKPLTLDMDLKAQTLRGSVFNRDSSSAIQGHIDNYLCIATWTNYSEQWKDGRQICTGLAAQEDLESMIQQTLHRQVFSLLSPGLLAAIFVFHMGWLSRLGDGRQEPLSMRELDMHENATEG